MMKMIRRSGVLALIAALVMAPIAAPAMEMSFSDDSMDGAMAGDIFIGRPLGIAATVVGSALFIVSLPFSALGGNVGQAARALVVDPARFAFFRPLGEFK